MLIAIGRVAWAVGASDWGTSGPYLTDNGATPCCDAQHSYSFQRRRWGGGVIWRLALSSRSSDVGSGRGVSQLSGQETSAISWNPSHDGGLNRPGVSIEAPTWPVSWRSSKTEACDEYITPLWAMPVSSETPSGQDGAPGWLGWLGWLGRLGWDC